MAARSRAEARLGIRSARQSLVPHELFQAMFVSGFLTVGAAERHAEI